MIRFVLPAYNEEENLPPLIEKIGEVMAGRGPYQIVVVDDGSRDGTARVLSEQAARYPLEVVTHPVNLGLPRTIVDGLRHASTGQADDVVITLDADNTHEPHHAISLLERIREGCDVAIASRYRPGSREIGLSPHRRVLSLGVNLMLRCLLPIPGVRDYTCGYRAYRAGLLQRAFSEYGDRLAESTTFSVMAEILIKLGLLGARAAEAPLVLRYDQKVGASKMRVLRTVVDYLRLMARLWRLSHLRVKRGAAEVRGEVA